MGKIARMADFKGDQDIASLANIAAYLRQFPLFAGTFAYDTMAGAVVMTRPLPGADNEPTFLPVKMADPIEDRHVLRVQELLQLTRFPTAKKQEVGDAIDLVARDNCFNPLADSLRRLDWDGTQRLKIFAVRYLGAEDTRINMLFCRKWFISAVARALQPGCKADHMLILEGPQGICKSTAASIIAGNPAYFSNCLPDLRNKDAKDHLRGKWIVEIAELVSMKKAEIEATKAFISTPEDKFRVSYGKRDQTFKRSCVCSSAQRTQMNT